MNANNVPEKRKYPVGRYVALLLALALLLAGVTFARYYGTGGIGAEQPVAGYDVTYTVDGINSTSFGNMDYWQEYGGRWMEQGQGSARTVRLTAVNNSDVAVNPKLQLSAPAEFWDNVALQIFDTETGTGGTVAMGDPLTTQFVIADLVKHRTGGEKCPGPSGEDETHGYVYGGYRTWTADETYDTATSDTFGQTGSGEVELTVSGGLSASGGTVTATWNETAIAGETTPGEGGTGEGTDPSQPAEEEQEKLPGGVLSITAYQSTETFSVGFTRQVSGDSAPALYFDCERENALFYTVEIDLTGFSVPAATEDADGNRTPGTDTIVFALTWTNAVRSSDLTAVDTTTGSWDTTIKGIFNNFTNADGTAGGSPKYNDAAVTAAHIDVSDAPVVALSEGIYAATGELTRMRVRLFAGSAKKMEFMHIASLSSEDGSYPHEMKVEDDIDNIGNIFTCVGTTPTSVDISQYTAEKFAEIVVKKSTIGAATEKSYALQIGVNFVQASESPAQP